MPSNDVGARAPKRGRGNRRSPYRSPASYGFFLAHVAILAVIGWVGWNAGADRTFTRPQAWLLILVLMAAFALLAGRGITGYWRGILIDQRNKMSLSRLQLLVWTLVILSAIVTIVLTNVALGSEVPLALEIPPAIWVLLGISTASAVGGPAVLNSKHGGAYDPTELKRTAQKLKSEAAVEVDPKRSNTVIYNRDPDDARWGDLLKGDEVGDAMTVDLGKLQMFFFTFVLVLGYAAAVATLLQGDEIVSKLPPIDQSMNTLLGISHIGYLATKTVSHSKQPERAQVDEPPNLGGEG